MSPGETSDVTFKSCFMLQTDWAGAQSFISNLSPHVCFQISEMPKPAFLSKSLEELNIGTFQNIAMVHTDTPLYTALGIFVDQRVSALPVIDDNGETWRWFCESRRLGEKCFTFYYDVWLQLTDCFFPSAPFFPFSSHRKGGWHILQVWRHSKFLNSVW